MEACVSSLIQKSQSHGIYFLGILSVLLTDYNEDSHSDWGTLFRTIEMPPKSNKKNKKPEVLTRVPFQHDNDHAHTPMVAMGTIYDCILKLFLHPPYLPDLALFDFNLFPI